MNRFWICCAVMFASLLVGELLTVRLYWGYWGMSPPSSDETVEPLASVDRFTKLGWGIMYGSGTPALQESAQYENYGVGEDPAGRLAGAILRKGLKPNSDEPIPTAEVDTILGFFDSEGYDLYRNEGPNRADHFLAYVATGKSADGDRVLVIGLCGEELSNDHRPYYEAALVQGEDGEWSLVRYQQYQYDIAGMEGTANHLGGFCFMALCAPILACVLLLHGSRRVKFRGSSHRTAPDEVH